MEAGLCALKKSPMDVNATSATDATAVLKMVRQIEYKERTLDGKWETAVLNPALDSFPVVCVCHRDENKRELHVTVRCSSHLSKVTIETMQISVGSWRSFEEIFCVWSGKVFFPFLDWTVPFSTCYLQDLSQPRSWCKSKWNLSNV